MKIYLDYAATTPVDDRVAAEMMKHLTYDGVFANPASNSHELGWQADAAVGRAREQVAALIGASPKEIVWTSGATESDNLAIKGAAQFYSNKGKHIITAKTEHKAVLDTCAFFQRQGYEISYLDPNEQGVITAESVAQAIRPDTILISVMYVNNETGIVNEIPAIGKLAREKGIVFHVDGAQATGKIAIDVKADNIDLLSLTAHKVYGPKGIGALYVSRKPRIKLQSQMHGGGHERGFRSGTLPTHQIVGMGEAYRLATEFFEEDIEHTRMLTRKLWKGIQALPGVYINGGDGAPRSENVLNVRFENVDGEHLMRAIDMLAVSSGSACISASFEPSYVLRVMGLSNEQASRSVRFSVGRMTTQGDIEKAIECVVSAVTTLSQLTDGRGT